MTESRAWCFTLNNYTEEEDKALQELECNYLIYGYEVAPETGTPHLQGYVRFKFPKKLEQVKAKIPRAHLEKSRGTIEDNISYCMKTRKDDIPNEKVFEKGERPKTQKEKGQSEKERWATILGKSKAGDTAWIDENEPEVAFKHAKTIDFIVSRNPAKLANLESRKVHKWLWGVPNSGKSWDARQFGPFFFKNINKWWCGYQNEDYIVIDEWEPKHSPMLADYLKKWADIYPFQAELKGGSKCIRPKCIIITSNYSLEDCFGYDPILLEAIRGRFQETHYRTPYVVDHASIGFDY